ncbi:MAG TPA: ATP-binding protein [Burkholderiaceae bacterium]|nr:ATP-binding protein [Burkholderiaceae bacterium]
MPTPTELQTQERSHTAQVFAGLRNVQQLIQLRWMAAGGQVFTILVVQFAFGIPLPLQEMAAALGLLVLFNLVSIWYTRRVHEVTDAELFVALLVDVATLTVQLYLSGGVTNPFIFLFLLQVTLGAVLLRPAYTWVLVAITAGCFLGLSIFYRPLAIPLDHSRGLASPYLLGLLVCFGLIAGLLVVFITRIMLNLRTRDARLANLRQRAAEEEHIVRMGLLASGAAHELGTPLATLAVILGDWRRLPHFSSDPELLLEVCEMQTQLERCKAIVSGILLSAGEARGESSGETTLGAFMDDLVEEWRRTRPVAELEYENRFGSDPRIVSDSAVTQMICNVLDNALEASAKWLRFEVAREDDTLLLTVVDNGPGFQPAMLAALGKPYQSSKGRPGGGLGLFLVVNVARTLGGRVVAQNRLQGGAEVKITLPLSAVLLEEQPTDGS